MFFVVKLYQVLVILLFVKSNHAHPYYSRNEENLNTLSNNTMVRNELENCKASTFSFPYNENDIGYRNSTKLGTVQNSSLIHKNVRVCPFHKRSCDLNSEGLNLTEVLRIMKKSTDYFELLYLWEKWESATLPLSKALHVKQIDVLKNSSLGSSRRWSYYRSEDFMEKMEKLWREVSPLYFEIHRFLKRKLEESYGSYSNFSDGLLPAHLLDIMSPNNWLHLYEVVKPYPQVDDVVNFTNEKSLEALQIVNDFYISMGLDDVIDHYNLTIVVGNKYEINCNFTYSEELPRICETLSTQSCPYKEETPNPFNPFYELSSFHYHLINKNKKRLTAGDFESPFVDGVGDLLSILSLSPSHINEINEPELPGNANEELMNFLMRLALKKVVFLSYIMVDFKWKCDILNNEVRPDQYGNKWWHYREKIQKIKNPVPEISTIPIGSFKHDEETDFINYFIATVLEFQLYRGLCDAEKGYYVEESPLHTCDLYGHVAAGEAVRDGLKLSTNKEWSEALFDATDDSDLSADALMDYFDPLFAYLKEQNGPLTEAELANLLQDEYEDTASTIYKKQVVAEWASATDVNNDTKREIQLQTTLQVAEFEEHYRQYYFQDLVEAHFENESLRRQLEFLTVIGNSALDSNKLSELTNVTNTMTHIYSTAKVCPFGNQNCDLESQGLALEPDIENIMSTSTNYEELQYLWVAWRNATGVKMKNLYPIYVNLSNEAALENGFIDMAEMWVSDFESETFGNDMEELWQQVKPLYDELHQYVSNKLKKHYGDVIDLSDNLIPAHVLGNMWAQSWINIRNLVRPFPKATDVDITSSLLAQNYTVLKMFKTSDDFYQSLGLESASMSYNSSVTVLEKPTSREVQCHGSAWDFYDRKDFRIMMCTSINYEDFVTIHHEMGHIQYYMLYKDQPISFRNGANPGFHEAVGDVITLSVTTPKHLKEIGLLSSYEESYESSINSLMDVALDKVAFLPFGYLIDRWRWDIFKGLVLPEKWNSHWWHYRKTIQKVKPPVARFDEIHFDPGSKFHVPNDYQYISYFVAHILQFQLYKSFCTLTGQYDPKNASSVLHKCDFYNSTEVGDKLRAGLSLGASKHWRDVLKEMSNETEYDASALREYFAPLYEYLVRENRAAGEMKSRLVNGSTRKCFYHLEYFLLFLLYVIVHLIC